MVGIAIKYLDLIIYARTNRLLEQNALTQGYLHPLYAKSFSEIGTPLYLPKSKGWLIKRQIPSSRYFDAMCPYPLFFCQNWSGLLKDLENLREELVSVSMVIDPFSTFYFEEYRAFFDVFTAYKDHYLLDLKLPPRETVSKNKRKTARRALRDLSVVLQLAPHINIDEWVNLYKCLIERHQIKGIRTFSRESFSKQTAIPNTHFFKVLFQDKIIGGNLFYIQNGVAYSHLSAFTPQGYALGAAYAVKWVAIKHLSECAKWLNLGGGTGSTNRKKSGLDLFKQGWSNKTAKSYFCGKILNPQIYEEITTNRHKVNPGWFPAYRTDDY